MTSRRRPRRAPGPRHGVPGRLSPLVQTLWLRVVPVALVALGIEMRLLQWTGARSLWLDEALIARSLVSRDFTALVTEPLQGDQAAPVLWLWASRLSVELFGTGERALRLVPLLGGIAALLLTWVLARRLLPSALVPVALALAVLSPSLLYYSNEVKPYSVDVAVSLALVLLTLSIPSRPGPRTVLPLALAGAVAVWASFASVFVLAGLSVLLVLRARRIPASPDEPFRTGDKTARLAGLPRAGATGLVLSLWLASVAASYVLVLHRLRSSSILSDYWAYSFPDRPADLPSWLVRRAVDLVSDPLSLSFWPVVLVLLGVGAWQARRLAPDRFATAAAGLPVALVAAALSAYPFASRLALWMVPLAMITLAAAVPLDLRRPWALLFVAGSLVLISAPTAPNTLRQSVQMHQVEELRPVMKQLKQQQRPGDLVLVEIAAKAPFDFYTAGTGLGRDGVILFATPDEVGGRCNEPAALAAARFPTQRVWVVFSHALVDTARLGTRADLLARIEQVTQRARTIQEVGAEAVLFDPQAPPGPRSTEPRNDKRCLAVVRTIPPTMP